MAVNKLTVGFDWDDLRVFVELARRGSLSAAARALGLTHATVGRRLATLEAALGLPLVERRRDGCVLTPESLSVLELATEMEAVADAIRRRGDGGPDLAGSVRLSATEAMADRFLIPRLGAFRARHPGIDLEVVTDNRVVSLARREADVAIRLARPVAGDLVTRRLGTMAYRLYAAPSYLAERPSEPESAGGVFIAYDDTLADLPEAVWLAGYIGDVGTGARVGFRSNSLQAQWAAARTGLGLALLPCWLADDDPALVPVETPVATPEREVWLLVHGDRREVPRVRAVIDHVVAVFTGEANRLAGLTAPAAPAPATPVSECR